jgi:hypothetical protein
MKKISTYIKEFKNKNKLVLNQYYLLQCPSQLKNNKKFNLFLQFQRANNRFFKHQRENNNLKLMYFTHLKRNEINQVN